MSAALLASLPSLDRASLSAGVFKPAATESANGFTAPSAYFVGHSLSAKRHIVNAYVYARPVGMAEMPDSVVVCGGVANAVYVPVSPGGLEYRRQSYGRGFPRGSKSPGTLFLVNGK